MIYPCMQCTDIFFLDVDVCQLGIDQRKVNMLAIGMRKNEPRLKARLDDFVKAQLKSGELNTIYKKFHGADLPADVTRNAG